MVWKCLLKSFWISIPSLDVAFPYLIKSIQVSALKEFSRELHAYYQQVAVLQSALCIDLNKSEYWGIEDSDWSRFWLLEAWFEFLKYLKSALADCEVVSITPHYFWNNFFFLFSNIIEYNQLKGHYQRRHHRVTFTNKQHYLAITWWVLVTNQ